MNILDIKELECPNCKSIQKPKFQGKVDVENSEKPERLTIWVCPACKSTNSFTMEYEDIQIGDERERRPIILNSSSTGCSCALGTAKR